MQFLLGGLVALGLAAAEPELERPEAPVEDGAAPDAREQALEQLEQLGQQVRASATATLELIASTNAPVELRQRAVLALATLGLENPEQARILFTILADPGAETDLRRTILMAFGEKELFAPLLLPALLELAGGKRNDTMLRREALYALRRFASQQTVLPVLVRVLADPDEDFELRLAMLDHLRMFVADPTAAVEVLSALVNNRGEPGAIRERAIDALRGFGDAGRPAAATLAALVSDGGEETALRLSAARALRQTGWGEAEAGALVGVLFHPDTPEALRGALAELTAGLDGLPPLLATVWLPVLEDPNAPLPARRLAARLLATADLGLPDGLALSTRLLRDRNEDLRIRRNAGEFLRRSGVRAAPARETLENILLNEEAPPELREVASTALAQVAQVWLDRPDQLDRPTLNQHLAAIDHTVEVMEQSGLRTPPHPQNLEAVRRLRDVLRTEKASRWLAPLGDWAEAHPGLARGSAALLILGLYGGLLTAGWWGMTRFAPWRLGTLDARLRRHELTLPRALGRHSLGLRHLLLLNPWASHARVLDAWTRHLRSASMPRFENPQRQPGDGRFLDLPVKVGGVPHDACPFERLFCRLQEPGRCVTIVGDAGTGKTTLARQLARRACAPRPDDRSADRGFVPIWMDGPLRLDKSGLVEFVREQLRTMPGHVEAPPEDLLRAMLARGRVVPILDGVSEWNIEDRQATLRMLAADGDPPVVITSRLHGIVDNRQQVKVEIPRLAGPELARFVSGFLEQDAPDLNQPDVIEACGYWAELTAGRATPADGVRLFAEYLRTEPEAPTGEGRPESVLELFRKVIRRRNYGIKDVRLPDELVLQAAGQLAWLCVQLEGPVDPGNLPDLLTPAVVLYLEEMLSLVRNDPVPGGVRFLQPTLADHLAAGHLIEVLGRNDAAWRRLDGGPSVTILPNGSLRGPGDSDRLAEALWQACHRVSDPFAPTPIPDWLLDAIGRQSAASGDDGARPDPRLRQLVRLVLAPENPERTAAIQAMVAMGAGAAPALATLLNAFRKAGEDLEIRHAVLTVILLLGRPAAPAAAALRLAIQDRQEHLFLRLKAIDALVAAAPDDPASVELLIDKSRDPAESGLLRSRASQAIATKG